jgi:hypothetical protein
LSSPPWPLDDSWSKDFTDPGTIFWAGLWALLFYLISTKKGAFLMMPFLLSLLLAYPSIIILNLLLVATVVHAEKPTGRAAAYRRRIVRRTSTLRKKFSMSQVLGMTFRRELRYLLAIFGAAAGSEFWARRRADQYKERVRDRTP